MYIFQSVFFVQVTKSKSFLVNARQFKRRSLCSYTVFVNKFQFQCAVVFLWENMAKSFKRYSTYIISFEMYFKGIKLQGCTPNWLILISHPLVPTFCNIYEFLEWKKFFSLSFSKILKRVKISNLLQISTHWKFVI